MPLRDIFVNRIRKSSWRAFRMLARGRGVSPCTYYPAVSGGSVVIRRNLYHDIVEDTGPGQVTGVDTYIYIDMNLPVKTVKELGWYREDESLPIVGFMPFEERWSPQTDAIITVPTEEGYLAGTYRIKKQTQYGQGVPCLWAFNLVPKRKTT
jgi:hypothetical protein